MVLELKGFVFFEMALAVNLSSVRHMAKFFESGLQCQLSN